MSRPSRSKTVDYAQFGADSGDSDEDFLGGSSYVHGEIDVENEEDDTYFVPAKERPVRVATRTTHAVIDLVGSDSEDYASTRQVTRKSLAKNKPDNTPATSSAPPKSTKKPTLKKKNSFVVDDDEESDYPEEDEDFKVDAYDPESDLEDTQSNWDSNSKTHFESPSHPPSPPKEVTKPTSVASGRKAPAPAPAPKKPARKKTYDDDDEDEYGEYDDESDYESNTKKKKVPPKSTTKPKTTRKRKKADSESEDFLDDSDDEEFGVKPKKTKASRVKSAPSKVLDVPPTNRATRSTASAPAVSLDTFPNARPKSSTSSTRIPDAVPHHSPVNTTLPAASTTPTLHTMPAVTPIMIPQQTTRTHTTPTPTPDTTMTTPKSAPIVSHDTVHKKLSPNLELAYDPPPKEYSPAPAITTPKPFSMFQNESKVSSPPPEKVTRPTENLYCSVQRTPTVSEPPKRKAPEEHTLEFTSPAKKPKFVATGKPAAGGIPLLSTTPVRVGLSRRTNPPLEHCGLCNQYTAVRTLFVCWADQAVRCADFPKKTSELRIPVARVMDEDPEINLAIPLRSIYEEFCCPICFETVSNCRMTSCGHNFCKPCIEECLNRKHSCPVCNSDTTIQKLVENKHFDRLAAIINDEKEKASKEYFEKLINGKGSPVVSADNVQLVQKKLSPIEEIFHNYMKKSLLNYEDYYQKLKTKHDERVKAIKDEFTQKMLVHQKKVGSKQKSLSVSQDREIAKLTAECELIVAQEEKSSAPAPEFLPVSVDVHIQDKDIRLRSILLKPTGTLKDLREVIKAKFETSGDPITSWSKENVFVIAKGNVVIHQDVVPIIQYGLDPGTVITLKGKIHCMSDAPKQCFKSTFVKDAGMVMDYYVCKDCSFNWICKSCAEVCHKGHNVVEYLHAHKPTWGCCYCVKKGTCILHKA